MSYTGYQKSECCLKQGTKISDICLKQGQGMRGMAAPPHQEIYRVPPPGLVHHGIALATQFSFSSLLLGGLNHILISAICFAKQRVPSERLTNS